MLKIFGKKENKFGNLALSAEFKRDYIALAATVAFFVIVLSEITLAVSIPMYLHRENSMAYQVLRLKLLNDFDGLRFRIRNTKTKNEAKVAELKIVEWNMNSLADYLREESDKLTADEIKELLAVVRENDRFVQQIRYGKNFSSVNTLDTSGYINSLIPKGQNVSGKDGQNEKK